MSTVLYKVTTTYKRHNAFWEMAMKRSDFLKKCGWFPNYWFFCYIACMYPYSPLINDKVGTFLKTF